jgi:putative membrane-bound dehydrogenase-like protein
MPGKKNRLLPLGIRTVTIAGCSAAILLILQGDLLAESEGSKAPTSSGVVQPEPLSPAESLEHIHLDEELRIELVVSEPLIQDPVAICWDARGSLYVAEMGDYPQQPQGGRIRKLEDLDGDGRYDQASLFVSQVAYPACVLPYQDGVLVAAAPDILWFRDQDGDGVAEHREVLLSGFVEGNPQLRVNGLVWGLDSWIYGANGRSGGNVYFPQSADQPGTSPITIQGRDFRFHPQQRKLETTGGFTQFGQSFDDFGNRFISFNTIHIRHVVMEQRYVERNPMAPITATTAEISLEGSTTRIYPISVTTQRFNAEPPGYFNASCGLSIYRGHLLPVEYHGNAFACEPLSNLVHRDLLEPHGTTFVARRPWAQSDREFLASSDPWFRPVNTATGPDGALYIVDFYRPWVEHPQFVADPDLRNSVDFAAGGQYGRIYRIVPRISGTGPLPTDLEPMDDRSLVEQLASPNAWQRETAQRLLVERRTNLVGLLRHVAATSENALQRLHAYGVLQGLDLQSSSHSPPNSNSAALRPTDIAQMLVDASSAVRRFGLQWCEPLAESNVEDQLEWIGRITPLIDDLDPKVRLQAVASLGYFNHVAKLNCLVHAAQRDGSDPWMRQAIFAAIGGQSVAFTQALMESRLDIRTLDFEQLQWLLLVAGSEASLNAVALEQLWLKLHRDADMESDRRRLWQLLLSVAIARRLGPEWVDGFASRQSEFAEQLRIWPQWATEELPIQHRLLAIAITEFLREPGILDIWRQCLTLEQPLLVQQWSASAAASVARLPQPLRSPAATLAEPNEQTSATELQSRDALFSNARADLLVAAVGTTSPIARRTILDLLIGRVEFATKLADAIQADTIPLNELDTLQKQLLLERLPPDRRQPLQDRMAALQTPVRGADLSHYTLAYDPNADRNLGRQLYQQHCQSCHAIGLTGNRVGPDLTTVAGRSPIDIITDILAPNRSVASDGYAYALLTHDGEVISGVITGETASSVALKKAGGELVNVLRQDIQELRHLGKSLMPEGFESSLNPAQMSALVAFLKSPDEN